MEQKVIKFPVNSRVKFPKEFTRGLLELRNAEWRVIEVIAPGERYWQYRENSCQVRTNNTKDYMYHCTFYSDRKKHAIHRYVFDNDIVPSLPEDTGKNYQVVHKILALGFMNYLDEHRGNEKMCLSNGECEDIEKAIKEQDWEKLNRYCKKYLPEKEPKGKKYHL